MKTLDAILKDIKKKTDKTTKSDTPSKGLYGGFGYSLLPTLAGMENKSADTETTSDDGDGGDGGGD
jgi:hypothetical protein